MSIYVLRSDNLVKIGFSDNLRNRVQAIIASVPVAVEFVGHMPGGRDLETHLHEIFDASHFSGEWFVETEAMRSLFDTVLIPRMPLPETQEEIKRTAEKTDTQKISQRVKDAAVVRWPTKSKSELIDALANGLGWSRTRAKDFFYADPRIVLRAYELQEVDRSLCELAPPGG